MGTASMLFTDIVGIIAVFGILQFLRRRLLTNGMGLVWLTAVVGLMVFVTVPALRTFWIRLSSSIFESPPYVIVLMLFLLALLLYHSVVMSLLQRQVREMGQFIALSQAHAEDEGDSLTE